MEIPEELRKIVISCPICHAKKDIDLPLSIIDKAKQLTTVSIPKGCICNHHFQLFIDKNYVIRGFQKVDFEVNHPKSMNKDEIPNNLGIHKDTNQERKILMTSRQKSNHKSLKEIYEEFWEFINDDNETFQPFIRDDARRK